MFEFIREHQLNLMLLLCGGCAILIFLLLHTRFLTRGRKMILFFMELEAFCLLWFDRLAYIYAGDPSHMGYIMVRLSNFMVFFLTPGIVLGLNLYVRDWLLNEGQLKTVPRRLLLAGTLAVTGMILAVVAALTNLYYYFDETNLYHRGSGFLIAYIIPLVCPLIQLMVVLQYRRVFGRLIFTSLLLYVFIPVSCGILQIFTYGISIVNMAMVAVSISMYIFMYLDLNEKVIHAHEIEIQSMQGEQKRMQRLFDQTATAFVSAVEKKDEFTKGKSIRVAEYAKKIAALAGKSAEDCEKVYYAALLHDVGLIGIPDSAIWNENGKQKQDREMLKKKPEIGAEILSSITEYPYLSQGAHYSHERYNGSGYPDGLKGKDIPEIARIIGVADAYVSMISRQRYRDAHPEFMVREAFMKGAGEEFDPVFAEIMMKIMDAETNEKGGENTHVLETEIICREYRENVSSGISVEADITRISFDCEPVQDAVSPFSAPSIVLFDSYDALMHDDARSIDGYHYLEYAEVWFDKHSVTTAARTIAERELGDNERIAGDGSVGRCEIIAGRCGDHLKLVMRTEESAREVIVALPNSTNAVYIGLTGENCRLFHIKAEPTGEQLSQDDVQRIAQPISYIDHLESDLKNVQVDTWRSAATEGVEVIGQRKIFFHTMSLPGANLIWHCPYIVLYSSDDGRVGGANYQEYQMIKLNGEDDSNDKPCQNRFSMKKTAEFPGWEKWKEINKEGMECAVYIDKKGDQITLRTSNLGIELESVTSGISGNPKLYVALTGDQVALTDIRVD